MSGLLSRAHGAVQRAFGVKVSRYAAFEALFERATRASQFEQHVEALQAEVGSLKEQLEESRAQARISKARADWLEVSFQQAQFWQRRADALAAGSNGPEPGKRKLAVTVITAAAQITQLKALARSERVREGYDLLVVAFIDPDQAGLRDYCRQDGLTMLSHTLEVLNGSVPIPSGEPGRDNFTVTLDTNMSACVETLEERDIVRDLGRLAAEIQGQLAIYRNAERLLRDSGASLLILFEDNAEYETGTWTRAARENGIASVILPYTIADATEPAEFHYYDPLFWAENGSHNRLASTAMPHWLYKFRDRWLLRRPGAAILAAEAIGVAPPMPWILNSTKGDAIAAESEAMRAHYVKLGIPQHQLRLTGSLADNSLYAAQQDSAHLRAELGLDPAKKVLLCAIPTNQLPQHRPECEWQEFSGIVDFWLGELAKLRDWQVLIKPHPSMKAHDLDTLRRFGFPVLTDHDTSSLIPLCDLYNASVSSTIRWALACGKPVLNYDVFAYRYQDFTAEPAVTTVIKSWDFRAALQRLTGDEAALAGATKLAGEAASRWGMLDGNSMDRIVALFDDLTSRRRATAVTPR